MCHKPLNVGQVGGGGRSRQHKENNARNRRSIDQAREGIGVALGAGAGLNLWHFCQKEGPPVS